MDESQRQTLGSVGPVSGFLRDVRVAPDGLALTVSRYNDTDRVYDLMLMDLRRPTASQLTFGTSAVQSSWLPDRSAIVFSNVGTGGWTLVRMAPQEGAAQVPVLPSDEAIVTLSEGAPDGQSVVYVRIRPDGDADIYLHPLSPPAPIARSWRLQLSRRRRGSRPMARGLPTKATRRASLRSSSDPFRRAPTSCRSRVAAATDPSGDTMAMSCSISRATAT